MKQYFSTLLTLAALLVLTSCSEIEFASHVYKKGKPVTPQQGTFKVGTPYKVDGKWYYPEEKYDLVETGIASWYGPGFHGKRTANGEIFNQSELTAAHRTLQMPSLVRVTNLDNGRSIIVRINDRGPFKRSRVIDVSEKAAELLGFKHIGTAKVKLQVLKQESMDMAQVAKGGGDTTRYTLAEKIVPPETPTYDAIPKAEALGVAPVTREALNVPAANQPSVAGHTVAGQFYPDPVVKQVPVTNSNIYIQAGSFTVQGNAANLRDSVRQFGHAEVFPTSVNGQQFYRVRIGPVRAVAEADALLSRLMKNGYKNAIIVVE